MKVLHLESGRHRYGGPRQVGYLIEGLAARGVENLLVCDPAQPLAGAGLPARVETLPMGGDLDFGLTRRLARVIAAHRPDIVHVHSRRGADWHGGRASRLTGCPAVLTRRVESPEPRVLAALRYRPYRIVVAISRAVEAELAVSAAIAPRLRRIASAVDGERFRPDAAARHRILEAFELDDDAFVAACVAQLIPRKGHRFLLACWRDFVARRPGARLLLFGRGPDEAKLRRLVAAEGLEPYVKFAGFRDAMEQWLPGLDLLVHPAGREGLGAVVLEAMSAGLPVLAARAGGIVDLIESGVDGLLQVPGDRDAWVGELERLSGDADLRARLGRAARAKAARDFTIEAMTDRYLEVYADVRA